MKLVQDDSYSCRGQSRTGFTLIELSIVLVIVGLTIGGVTISKELIEAAQIRAQLTQLEQFNTAVRLFQHKYKCLPGDCYDAEDFGFIARGSDRGQGDGNGIIEGYSAYFGHNHPGSFETAGETTVFWVDLTSAQLMDGGFSTASMADHNGSAFLPTEKYLPTAKVGSGAYIYVWSEENVNYYGLSGITLLGWSVPWSTPGVKNHAAFNIDTKIDDGLPQSGKITARFLNYGYDSGGNGNLGPVWAMGSTAVAPNGKAYTSDIGAYPGDAENPSADTCYDNGGIASAPMKYTLNFNKGNTPNCALSMRFQ